jgi:hypothetical protein
MAKWDDFVQEVLSGLKTAATGALKGYVAQVESDGKAYLSQARTDLETWTKQLAEGQITKDDLAFNVQADVDIAKLEGLTDAGIGLEALQTFRDTLVNTVVDAAFKVFVPVP